MVRSPVMGRIASSATASRSPKETAWSGAILSKTARRTVRGTGGRQKLKSGFRTTFDVQTNLWFDFDQRFLVDFVSKRLADHYSKSLLRGVRADGRGRLQTIKPATESMDQGEGRKADWVGMRSGWMARHWWLGKIRGSSLKASRLIKPNGGSGGRPMERKQGKGPLEKSRASMIDAMLERSPPIDLQSVVGSSAKVIVEGVNDALPLMVGDRLGMPARVSTAETTLDKVRVP